MSGRKRSLVIVLGLILSLLAIGMVAAQDDTSSDMPFLGVRLMEDENGVTIAEVVADSPAADAELAVGDVITAVNGEAVDGAQAVTDAIRAMSSGDTVTLDITRGGETLTVEATLGTAPAVIEISPGGDGDDRRGQGGRRGGMDDPRGGMRGGMMMPGMHFLYGNGWLGVSFVTLDVETAAENEVELTEGALILSVEEDSPAAEAGLQEGDVVTAVNGEPVDAERTLRDRLIAYEPNDVVTLTITRGGESQDIDVTLGEPTFERGGFGLMPFDLDQLREMFPELDIQIPELNPEATPEMTPETSANA